MAESESISADFPFESRFAEVLGSRMHYIEQGEGEPVVFLHGNPTSSYLWRNVIPHVATHARCIAPDLIGMGKSDKPRLAYRFADHARYFAAFIEALGLERVTLVVHDWGSGLGFDWARQHPERVRGLAFMEAILRPAKWADFPKDYKLGFKLMRTPGVGWIIVSGANVFVNKILPGAIVRTLSAEEMKVYRAPYRSVGSRKPVRRWPCEIPIDGKPADVHALVSDYSEWLQTSEVPKLLLHARPGALITADTVEWCQQHLPNLDTVDIGKGTHFVQEDNPHGIGRAIARWYQGLA